jgi:histidine triad (HIT) family protein
MTENATSAAQGCIFCAIVARQSEASVVYEDETVVIFMDLDPATPGHLLVVPREHAMGLEDLDGAASAHVLAGRS